MYDILAYPLEQDCSEVETDPGLSPEQDPWLMTDRAAKALYLQRQCLDRLYDDLITHVMRDGSWGVEEVESHQQLQTLLHARRLRPKGTFAYVSPHAPVYQAVTDGCFWIQQHKYAYEAGSDLVFMPWPVRAARPSLHGPIWIGHLHTLTQFYLCCELFPCVSQLCQRTISVLRATLAGPEPSRPANHHGPRPGS